MLSLFRTHTFVATFLALCFGIALVPSVHAQAVVPNAFVDGQRHYIFGGFNGTKATGDAVMIDLTVSWNTSSPTIERLPNSNAGTFWGTSTVLPNGNMFTFSYGNGYVYDVRTNIWSIEMTNLPVGIFNMAASDMETGLVYIPCSGFSMTGPVEPGLLELDLKAKTVNNRVLLEPTTLIYYFGTWSAPLRSILFYTGNRTLYTYTPSKVDGTSNGWGTFETTGGSFSTNVPLNVCFVSAHNGSTMVLLFRDSEGRMNVNVLDVETRTWKSGPFDTVTNAIACSVSGDQLISYGMSNKNTTTSPNSVSVYNMKTEKWVTTYTPPPPQPMPTSPTQPGSNTDSNTDSADDHSNKTVIIIVVTGVLLAIILTSIATYIGATKRSKSRGQATSSDGSADSSDLGSDVTTPGKVLAKGVLGLRNPVDAGINSKKETPDRAAKP
ncbi:hypothetical protein BGX31_011512, partial [Mortierella sp. GBA43]